MGRDIGAKNSYSSDRCVICGTRVYSYTFRKKYCKKCKRLRKQIKCNQILPKDCYVYGWYREGSKLPFYVGKGTGQRAWRYGKLQAGVTVKIFRDSLTDEGAILVEAVLIQVFLSLGAALHNKTTGSRRRQPGLLERTAPPCSDFMLYA